MNNFIMPVISVIMSVYKEPFDWLEASINSILTQTYSNFEFIIINDNPANNDLRKFLKQKEASDSRIKLIINQQNIGLTKSLNIGLRLARGKYIARMDADDISMPNRFHEQINFLESHPNVIVCGTNIKYIGIKSSFIVSDWIKYTNSKIKAQMLYNSAFAHPTVIIRNQILQDNFIKYDEEYRQSQDYRLWETLYKLGEFANLPQKLLHYRLSVNQISRKLHAPQENNGILIRRRLIQSWLYDLGIVCDINSVDYKFIKKRIKPTIYTTEDKLKYKILLKIFYFSRDHHKIKYFFYAIILGDFFKMTLYDQLRYIAIMIGKKKAIEW